MEEYGDIGRAIQQEKLIENVLMSSLDPVGKVRRLVGLGIDESDADEMVERYQIGQMAPVYYERLDFSQIDED